MHFQVKNIFKNNRNHTFKNLKTKGLSKSNRGSVISSVSKWNCYQRGALIDPVSHKTPRIGKICFIPFNLFYFSLNLFSSELLFVKEDLCPPVDFHQSADTPHSFSTRQAFGSHDVSTFPGRI
jgi:hypothetical protein